MMGAAQLAIADTGENFPRPSPLVRQFATTPPPSPPTLQRKGAEIVYEETPFPEPLETLSREEQLRMEIAELREKIQKKKEKKQKESAAPKEKTTSWADMCESEYESDGEDLEEGNRWEDYESESDGEFAKVAPQLDGDEDEEEEDEDEEEKGWSTVTTKGKGKKRGKNKGWDVIPQKRNTTLEVELQKNRFLLLR